MFSAFVIGVLVYFISGFLSSTILEKLDNNTGVYYGGRVYFSDFEKWIPAEKDQTKKKKLKIAFVLYLLGALGIYLPVFFLLFIFITWIIQYIASI
jgi:hypothetical protein